MSARPGRRARGRAVAVVAIALGVLGGSCASNPDASGPTTVVTATATTAPTAGETGTTKVTAPTGTTGTTFTDGTLLDPATGTSLPNPELSAKGGAIGRDTSFPELGHPGYDVRHYDLDLAFDPATAVLSGSARIELTSVDALSEVVFDLRDLEVDAVDINGSPAKATRQERTVTVALPYRLEVGVTFDITIRYHGRPLPVPTSALNGVEVGWHSGAAGSVVMSEPEGASSWFPVNNHPLDKATYTIAVNVPKPLVAVSNGRLERTDDLDDTRTFHWVMDKPMANYLATVVTGDLEEREGPTADGVTYSSWVPRGSDLAATVDDGQDAVEALAAKLGPFPFATYGTVVYNEDFVTGSEETQQFLGGVALETQGRSLYSEHALVGRTYVHETAHQWMGDNVSLTDWSRDLWWIEGFARFAETAVAAGDEPLTANDFADAVASCGDDTAGDIPREELFTGRSYSCGALVFFALHQEVGPVTFWAILREFNDRFRYANASTEDLVDVASDVAERDLAPFFETWLFATERPALPE